MDIRGTSLGTQPTPLIYRWRNRSREGTVTCPRSGREHMANHNRGDLSTTTEESRSQILARSQKPLEGKDSF